MNRVNIGLFASNSKLANWRLYLIAATFIYICLALPALAQDATPTNPVTADDINAVAKQMYCPVCENIPLDVCPTDACQQWREEIGNELASGKTPDEIKSAFVARYGDRVVGTPEDPTLRALSLVATPVVAVIAILVAGWVVLRWRRNRQVKNRTTVPAASPSISDDDYRARLEQDLLSRR